MNASRPFTRSANQFFRPALDFLNNTSNRPNHSKKRQPPSHRYKSSASSLDDTDHEDADIYSKMDSATTSRASHSGKNSLSELQPPVPLIDVGSGSATGGSRATSPYPRSRSAVQSEDEDDDFEPASSIRPLVSSDVGSGGRGMWRQGGLGGFFFSSWLGWQIWVGLLVFWVSGCSFATLLMNRFIFQTGVYKFPYPIAGTYLQLLITHLLLLGFSSLTRGLQNPLRKLGFGAAVAPAYPNAQGGFRGASAKRPSVLQFGRWLANGTGGIAGGGLFEFDTKTAKQVLPLAIVFVAKLLLSNVSFYSAPLAIYHLSRIAVVPTNLLISSFVFQENHSTTTLSAALIPTLNLLFANIRTNERVSPDTVVYGVLSTLPVALYPLLLLRTYRTLVNSLTPAGDIPSAWDHTPDTTNTASTRAYFRLLHYLSLLSLMILTPILLISGDLPSMIRKLPFLDVTFFWFMIFMGSLASFAVFVSTPLLVKSTSPLTATFLMVPRAAFQLVVLSGFKMPAHSWVGVTLCWVSSAWFLIARREEARVWGVGRIGSG